MDDEWIKCADTQRSMFWAVINVVSCCHGVARGQPGSTDLPEIPVLIRRRVGSRSKRDRAERVRRKTINRQVKAVLAMMRD